MWSAPGLWPRDRPGCGVGGSVAGGMWSSPGLWPRERPGVRDRCGLREWVDDSRRPGPGGTTAAHRSRTGQQPPLRVSANTRRRTHEHLTGTDATSAVIVPAGEAQPRPTPSRGTIPSWTSRALHLRSSSPACAIRGGSPSTPQPMTCRSRMWGRVIVRRSTGSPWPRRPGRTSAGTCWRAPRSSQGRSPMTTSPRSTSTPPAALRAVRSPGDWSTAAA